MKRRNFIRGAGTLAGSLLLPGIATAIPGIPKRPFAIVPTGPVDEETWKIIRKLFLFPEDFCYLNTGGIGAVPTLVLDHMRLESERLEKNPGPGHDLKKWNELKTLCAVLLGPGVSADELALTSTATEGINIILNGIDWKEGDEIITSLHEHPALHIPLLNLHQRKRIIIKSFEPDLHAAANNVSLIDQLISRRTRMIFISHVTCTTGQAFPVNMIGLLARNRKILFALDGAQAAGTMPMDLKKWNVDFYAFSGHKWLLGPKRTGVLFVDQKNLDLLHPTTVGAYSDDGFSLSAQSLKFHPTAQRYEYGTQNETLFLGFMESIRFLNTLHLETVWEHNHGLAENCLVELSRIPSIEILTPEEKDYRTTLLSFRMKNLDIQHLSEHLSSKRIRVRVVNEAGLNAIRVSFHLYNSLDDVTTLITALQELQ
jgi:selenocysteine lyase/cysteine desulfurase